MDIDIGVVLFVSSNKILSIFFANSFGDFFEMKRNETKRNITSCLSHDARIIIVERMIIYIYMVYEKTVPWEDVIRKRRRRLNRTLSSRVPRFLIFAKSSSRCRMIHKSSLLSMYFFFLSFFYFYTSNYYH